MFEPVVAVGGPLLLIVRPGARPGGRKRTEPAPRFPPTVATSVTVAPAAVNGAWMNGALFDPAFPVAIASWLSALIPMSSNGPSDGLIGIDSTVEDALNGAAIENTPAAAAETTRACAPSGATMMPSRSEAAGTARATGVELAENGAV